MHRAVSIVIYSGWIAAGCVPMYGTARAEKTGSVVDARSGKPIANARVRVETYRVPTPPGFSGGELVHALDVATDAAGRWEIPSERDWTIGILAADGMPLYVDVYCLFASGYQSTVRNPHKAWLGVAVTTPKDATDEAIEAVVRLEPLGTPASPAGGVTECGVPL